MADFLEQLEKESETLASLERSSLPTNNASSQPPRPVVSAFQNVLNLVEANAPELVTVNLRYQNLTSEQVAELCEFLKSNTSVTALQLNGNELKLSSVRQIANMLQHNTTIQNVDMRFCDLDDMAIPPLVSALKSRDKQLQTLQILGNHFSVAGEAELLQCVATNPLSSLASPLGASKSKLTASSNIVVAKSSAGAPALPRSHSEVGLRSTDDRDALRTTCEALMLRIEAQMKTEAALKAQVAELERQLEKDAVKEKKKQKDEIKKSTAKINLRNVQVNEQLADVGGSGAVIYSCLVDGWQCAMKEMSLKGVLEYSLNSFETEISLLEKLPFHPNIVRYLFHERKGDKLRLYMTKYSTSLRRIITKRKDEIAAGRGDFFTPLEICRWSCSVAAGLEFLHKQKVLHRDVKPDNVLCTLDVHDEVQTLAIADFDTAKVVSRSSQAKTTIGTPSYMAPEVFSSNQQPYDYKADVWSFGMTIYELVTLKEPYEDEDKFEVAGMIIKGKRPFLPNMPPEYKPLTDIYMALTQVDRDKRPELKDVRDRLQGLQWELQQNV